MSVRQVTFERWQQAQRWELSVWEAAQRKRGWRRLAWPLARPLLNWLAPDRVGGDDWNRWWARQFDGYRCLPSEVENYVELGCGPYTNTRLILQNRRARHIVCSDPLVRHYVKFKDAWLASQYRRAALLVDDHPIEACPFATDYFDVVVMINVLDHVRSADRCLEQAARIIKPGGYFVLGQDLTNEDDLRRYPDDLGHPIRLSREDVEGHLGALEPVLRKELGRKAGRNPEAHYATFVFVGRKLG